MGNKPIEVGSFFEEAQAIVKGLLDAGVPLRSAILDDWNASEHTLGPRIIYDGAFTEHCTSNCADCPIFQAVGDEDQRSRTPMLRRTLCRARQEQIDLLPSKQRYLNCKTIAQYERAFVTWIVERCLDMESLVAELDWVAGFRILFMNSSLADSYLLKQEQQSKERIFSQAIGLLGARNSEEERVAAICAYRAKWRTRSPKLKT